MHVKPLLISDWSNAYGIDFTNDVNDCINHVCTLEKTRSAHVKETMVTSFEVCEF